MGMSLEVYKRAKSFSYHKMDFHHNYYKIVPSNNVIFNNLVKFICENNLSGNWFLHERVTDSNNRTGCGNMLLTKGPSLVDPSYNISLEYIHKIDDIPNYVFTDKINKGTHVYTYNLLYIEEIYEDKVAKLFVPSVKINNNEHFNNVLRYIENIDFN